MICGQAQIVGLAPSLGAPSMTSYSLGLPVLWPDDSIGMDSLSPGDPAVSLRHSELTTARPDLPNELTSRAGCAPAAASVPLAAILAGMALGIGGSLLGLGVDSGWYQAVLVVHLASAVVGFGGSAVGTVMLRRAWAEGPDAAAAVRRSFEFASSRLVDIAAFLAGIAGVVAVIVGPWHFRLGWVTIAFVLYFAWLGIAHGALRPTSAKLATAMDDGPERADDAERLRRRAELWSALSNLVIVAAIVVMVVKPDW